MLNVTEMKTVNKQRLFDTPGIKAYNFFLSKFKFQCAGVTWK